ncbi:3430_t:CDS:2, partial [Dentiscutata erythropus]
VKPLITVRGFKSCFGTTSSAPDLPIKHIVPSSQAERDLLRAMANLTNRILSSTGSKSLSKIRNQHPEVFTKLETYYKIVQMLASYHYRLPTRRLVSELFNVDFTAETFDQLDNL